MEETLQMLDRDGERLEALRADVRAAEETVTDLAAAGRSHRAGDARMPARRSKRFTRS